MDPLQQLTGRMKLILKRGVVSVFVVLVLGIFIFLGNAFFNAYRIYKSTHQDKISHEKILKQTEDLFDFHQERIQNFCEDKDFAKNVAREKISATEDGEIIFHFE